MSEGHEQQPQHQDAQAQATIPKERKAKAKRGPMSAEHKEKLINNSWHTHLREFRKAHPDLKGQAVMKAASACYKKKSKDKAEDAQ